MFSSPSLVGSSGSDQMLCEVVVSERVSSHDFKSYILLTLCVFASLITARYVPANHFPIPCSNTDNYLTVDELPFNEPTPEEETAGLRDRVFDARCRCGRRGKKKNLGKDLVGTDSSGKIRLFLLASSIMPCRPTIQVIICRLYEYEYDIEEPRRGHNRGAENWARLCRF